MCYCNEKDLELETLGYNLSAHNHTHALGAFSLLCSVGGTGSTGSCLGTGWLARQMAVHLRASEEEGCPEGRRGQRMQIREEDGQVLLGGVVFFKLLQATLNALH